MKIKIRAILGGLAILPVFAVSIASAQIAEPIVIVTANENGRGRENFVGTGILPMPGILTAKGLFYFMGDPPNLVTGDVKLFDPGVGGQLSDDIRFVALPNNFGFLFFSGDNDGDLADTGLPARFSANAASITEGKLYIPTANEPGFVPGFHVVYRFLSGDSNQSVPEGGATIGLLGMGLAGLAGLRRFCR